MPPLHYSRSSSEKYSRYFGNSPKCVTTHSFNFAMSSFAIRRRHSCNFGPLTRYQKPTTNGSHPRRSNFGEVSRSASLHYPIRLSSYNSATSVEEAIDTYTGGREDIVTSSVHYMNN
ncbi:UDP-glucosyltransferase [Danaus plexippus plexippus]|uniref:UDP-glucosyltransferase n=1 Tax=Danaus plexippus plexippus TaxID=278856 RepID=A0A212EZE1_DANPL|nr:UDP-glucosyltransferase [Danaus plexippus plexippus]